MKNPLSSKYLIKTLRITILSVAILGGFSIQAKGFLGKPEESGFYSNVYKNYSDIKQSMFLYEASNQGNGNSASAFNAGLQKSGITCEFTSYTQVDNIIRDKNSGIETIQEKCSKNNEVLPIEKATRIYDNLSNTKSSLQETANQKVELLNNLSATSLYADGNIDNSDFDIIYDLEEIDKEIFGYNFEKYEGSDDSIIGDFLKDILSTKNKKGNQNPKTKFDNKNSSEDGGGKSNSTGIDLSSLEITSSGLQASQIEENIITPSEISNEENNSIEDELPLGIDENINNETTDESNLDIQLACIDYSATENLRKFDVYKAFLDSKKEVLVNEGEVFSPIPNNGTSSDEGALVIDSSQPINIDLDTTSGGEISSANSSSTIGTTNSNFSLNLDQSFGGYEKERDKWECDKDDLFCVKLTTGRTGYGIYAGSYFSLSKVLNKVAEHILKTNKTSLVQSRQATNNFENMLIIPNLSKMLRGMGIEVQWKPIPNLDSISEKNESNTWGKDSMLNEYFKHNRLDYKMQNSLANFEGLEEKQETLINSLGLSLSAPSKNAMRYSDFQKIANEKNGELQTVTRNRDQIELREDFLDQISELQKFVNYIKEFTQAVNNEIDKMKEINIIKN